MAGYRVAYFINTFSHGTINCLTKFKFCGAKKYFEKACLLLQNLAPQNVPNLGQIACSINDVKFQFVHKFPQLLINNRI